MRQGHVKRARREKEVEPMNRTFCSRIYLAVVLGGILGLLTGSALAQSETDLTHGVLIVHAPPDACLSQSDWPSICTFSELQDCASQNNDNIPIDLGERCWFVIAAFMQPSQWCGVAFGVQYEETAPSITASGFCVPSSGLEIPGTGWPAPGTGTSIATTDVPWSGNFQPVYWFFGYSYYGPGVFQLTARPGMPGQIAFANCAGEEFPADCYGAIGFGMPGVDCCPTELTPWACCLPDGSCILTADANDCLAQGGTWFPDQLCDAVECPTAPTPWACCLPDGSCTLMAAESDCNAQGGAWFPDMLCDAVNCSAPRACCVGETCYVLNPAECVALGGWPLPESVDCEPDPCGPVPAAPTTWGAVKAAYK
jgi:hypothetical protein